MRYRKLDDDDDMIFGHGSDDYYQDQVECVAQSLKTRLRLWAGEWYRDSSEGTPYLTEILGMGKKASAVRALQKRILDTEGVTEIESLNFTHDPETRKAVLTVTVNTEYGEVTVSEQ